MLTVRRVQRDVYAHRLIGVTRRCRPILVPVSQLPQVTKAVRPSPPRFRAVVTACAAVLPELARGAADCAIASCSAREPPVDKTRYDLSRLGRDILLKFTKHSALGPPNHTCR
jgi:hypothetical protein